MSLEDNLAPYVSHDDFRSGLPQGRFRVVVDPKLARGWVRQRLWLLPIVMAMIGAGVALALGGATWPGAALVFAGVALNRVVAWNAGKILLHLALRDPVVYDSATGGGIMEVQRV
ncbi:MAG: hypothetical protein ACO1PB_20630 [Ramlibacter sp.]